MGFVFRGIHSTELIPKTDVDMNIQAYFFKSDNNYGDEWLTPLTRIECSLINASATTTAKHNTEI